MKKIISTHVLKFDDHTDVVAICVDGSIWQKQLVENSEYVDDPWFMISSSMLDEERDETDDGTETK